MLKQNKLAEKRRRKSLKRKKAKQESRRKKQMSNNENGKGAQTPVFNPSKEEMQQAVLGLYEIQANVQRAINRLEMHTFALIKLVMAKRDVTTDELKVCSELLLTYDNILEFWDCDYEAALAEKAEQIEAQRAAEAAQQALDQIKDEAEVLGEEVRVYSAANSDDGGDESPAEESVAETDEASVSGAPIAAP